MSQPAEETDSTIQKWFSDVLLQESSAISLAAGRAGREIAEAIRLIEGGKGRVVVAGMGKMGCIARKAAGTFSSTGTPAIFLDPADALHGGLGMVTKDDVVLALSNSGETAELLELIPFFKRHRVAILAITGNVSSSLAKQADVLIDSSVEKEADPDSLAPTSSSTVALACCDGLAVALMRLRGFTKEQFAIFHPGGHLGRKLLLMARDLMHSGDAVPSVSNDVTLGEAVRMISTKEMGVVLIQSDNGSLQGILTDGDVRRVFEATADKDSNPLNDSVIEFMTANPTSVLVDSLAAQALAMMEEKQITALPVIDVENRVQGIIHMHDLIRSGLA